MSAGPIVRQRKFPIYPSVRVIFTGRLATEKDICDITLRFEIKDGSSGPGECGAMIGKIGIKNCKRGYGGNVFGIIFSLEDSNTER